MYAARCNKILAPASPSLFLSHLRYTVFMLPLVSAQQMRSLDAHTIERLGVPGAVLMENAARGVVQVLWRLQSRGLFDLYRSRVHILAGPGNNGGDGMVIARYLHGRGIATRLHLCAERSRLRGDALLHFHAALETGVPVQDCADEESLTALGAALQQLGPDALIVDALFGTGLSKSLRGPMAKLVHAINGSCARKLAVDLPSGLDADRGPPADHEAEAPAVIVRADYTVTFGFPKLGLVSAPGFTWAGEVFVVDIGIPEALVGAYEVRARLLDARCLLRLAQPRHALGHKGTHGHLLIVAGSLGKLGAAILATRAALRSGVGLCTLAAPSEAVAQGLGTAVLEAMSLPYSLPQEALPTTLDDLRATWLRAAHDKEAIAIGPGLPVSPLVGAALLSLIENGDSKMVLDADALNQLVGLDGHLLRAASRGRELVLTPHPGEAARLLGCTVRQVQEDRIGAARRLCQRTGAVVLLKGARTLVVAPAADGNQSAGPLSVCPTGSAAMGTGGMGDVLTGILGALLASGWPAYDAACAAAYWHGLAADGLSAARSSNSLLCASDVIDALEPARRQAERSWPIDPNADWPLHRI